MGCLLYFRNLATLMLQLQDHHVTYREIGTSIHSILHEHLTVKKIFSRWIPHNLSIAQKKDRVDWSKEMLQKYDSGASKYIYDIVYAYDPENKQQSTVWVFHIHTHIHT